MWKSEQVAALVTTLIVVGITQFRSLYFFKPIPYTIHRLASQREGFFDAVKGVAIVAVIVIHVVSAYKNMLVTNVPLFIFAINNMLRFAIPWFLIASGALLDPGLSGKKQTLVWYRRRLAAIGIPYALCTFVIALVSHSSLTTFTRNLITGRAAIPYYFVPVLFQCYALYPLLNRFRDKKFFLPAIFSMTLLSFLIQDTWHIGKFSTVFQYLFFFCYGMSLRSMFLQPKKTPGHLTAWVGIAFIALMSMAAFPGYYYNVSLFYSVALLQIFFSAKHVLESNLPSFRLLRTIGQKSLWIFLTHIFVVQATVLLIHTQKLPVLASLLMAVIIAAPISIFIGFFFSRVARYIAL